MRDGSGRKTFNFVAVFLESANRRAHVHLCTRTRVKSVWIDLDEVKKTNLKLARRSERNLVKKKCRLSREEIAVIEPANSEFEMPFSSRKAPLWQVSYTA